MTAAEKRFQVQQHDGLRWGTFSWPYTRDAAEENYSNSVKCWPDRAHRVLSPAGDRVLFYDPRTTAPHNLGKS